MDKPLVTVFISLYNCEDYISDALESILNQTYENLDILIVDDGSTDQSVEKVLQYKDERIRLIRNGKNRGIPYTRNVGLREARGKYIAIMDSDDISFPSRIERQVHYLEEHEDIDAVGSFYIQFGGWFRKRVKTKFVNHEDLRMMLLFYNPIANPSVMIRKSSLEKRQLRYHEDYFVAQDYQLWAQLIKTGKIQILPEYLLKYRFGHENISKRSNRQKLLQRKRLIDEIHRDLLDFYGIALNPEELEVFNNFFTENNGGSIPEIEKIHSLIKKIKAWNQSEAVFNHRRFLMVLDYCIVLSVNRLKLNLLDKLRLYYQLSNRISPIIIGEIIIKHIYRLLKK